VVSKILIGSDELIMGILDMKAIGIRIGPMTDAVEFTRGHAKSKPVPNPKKQVVWPLNHVRGIRIPPPPIFFDAHKLSLFDENSHTTPLT